MGGMPGMGAPAGDGMSNKDRAAAMKKKRAERKARKKARKKGR
jgi:hypothetical protein